MTELPRETQKDGDTPFRNTLISHVCYIPNFVALGQIVWASVGCPKNEDAGAPPHRDKDVVDRLKHSSTHLSYHATFGHSRSNRSSVIMEICLKILIPPPLSRSLKVTETDTDRSVTYEFLLVIRSNYGSILYRFRHKGQYLQK